MTTHQIELPEGASAYIFVTHGVSTSSAYGMLFNSGAYVTAETGATRYSGYCEHCIVDAELERLGVDPDSSGFLGCTCD